MDDLMDVDVPASRRGNPQSTGLPSSTDCEMEDLSSNDQQAPSSSSSADHQTMQNGHLPHDQQGLYSSSSAHPYPLMQNHMQSTGSLQAPSSSSSADHQTMQNSHLPHDQALTDQMVQSGQLSNVPGMSGNVITEQPTSTSGQGLSIMGRDNNKDFSAAGAGRQDFRDSLDDIKHENVTTGPSNKSDSEPNKISPDQIKPSIHQNFLASSAEGRDSGSSPDEQKHQDITTARTHKSQPEEDICRNGDESKTQSQHTAPEDTAIFKIKVISPTPFSEKWRGKLELALQSWFLKQDNRGEKQVSVLSLKLVNDGTCAEVEISPSTGLETLKKHGIVSLNLSKEVTAQICLDETESGTVSQNTKSGKNRIPTSKVDSTQPLTSAASGYTNNGADVRSETKTIKTDEAPSETSAGLPVPVLHFWYMLHAYRNKLQLIENQHGVSMDSEVLVSFRPTQRSNPDSVSKASEDFQKLLTECVNSFSEISINHNDMDSDIVKETFRNVQSEKTQLMFTMSASDCRFFGPKKFTDVIRRETTRAENKSKNKSNEMDVDDNISPQSRSSIDMDMKDLQTQLEMKKVHWDLIKLSYEEQISQLETKYGVSFQGEKWQKNEIKVQARSKEGQHINLEAHALRALTHLYQKLASAAVSCELKNPKHETDVAPLVEKLQQQHYCVVAEDVFSPWKLVGLPEHLGPAIDDIEKKLQKNVFDDKMKKLIGYLDDIPNARGIKKNQTPDYGPGAVGGAGRVERVNFRGRDETDSSFNKEDGNSKHDSKGAHAEEETCTICMDSFTDKTKLRCGHEFCQECINMSVKSLGPICPVCKEVFGKLEGNQPDGTITVRKSRSSLPGYPHCGTIEIHYSIPSGIQTEKHPNPGMPYQGASRDAYLPDNNEGNEVLALLQRAFKQKLIFTVGKSTTSGLDNVVTWNDIHHKTNKDGGPERYGYPDTDYLKRVKDELKAKGIK